MPLPLFHTRLRFGSRRRRGRRGRGLRLLRWPGRRRRLRGRPRRNRPHPFGRRRRSDGLTRRDRPGPFDGRRRRSGRLPGFDGRRGLGRGLGRRPRLGFRFRDFILVGGQVEIGQRRLEDVVDLDGFVAVIPLVLRLFGLDRRIRFEDLGDQVDIILGRLGLFLLVGPGRRDGHDLGDLFFERLEIEGPAGFLIEPLRFFGFPGLGRDGLLKGGG